MAYTLYTDKNENFECEVSVKNASLKDSFARLIVESDNIKLAFDGVIEKGKCVIPIRRLKGILDENTHGKMHLEVVVEDTYFKPWKSDFIVEEHTSVKVQVNEQKQTSKKPIVEVKSITTSNTSKKQKGINVFIPLRELSTLCELFDITKQNLTERKDDFAIILKEYFRENPEYINHKRTILDGLVDFIK